MSSHSFEQISLIDATEYTPSTHVIHTLHIPLLSILFAVAAATVAAASNKSSDSPERKADSPLVCRASGDSPEMKWFVTIEIDSE